MPNVTTYGPDGVTLVYTRIDHGDGTGTDTDWTTDPPTVTAVELPVPVPDPPSLAEVMELVPVTSVDEVNTVLGMLRDALEAKGLL